MRPITPEQLVPQQTEYLILMEFLHKTVQIPTRIIPRSPSPSFNNNGSVLQNLTRKWVAQHIFTKAGKKLGLNDLLSRPNATIWKRSISNELGRLSDGIPGCVRSTKAVKLIYKKYVPKNKKETYANMVCDYRPLKEE